MQNRISKYIESYGIGKTLGIIYQKLTKENQKRYDQWRKNHEVSEEVLEKQRNHRFGREPKFSIVVPLYKTNERYLRELIDSVRKQTYSNWELCLSDGSGKNSPLKQMLCEFEKMDKRIRVTDKESQMQISQNTNEGIAIASGDYIVFADHDDLLAPNALYECASVFEQYPEIEMIYSDEDKISMDGQQFFEPHFKPDYNPDLLCSVNYFCHLVVVSKRLMESVKGLDPQFDGAQDYDFVLRCTENTGKIYHIPEILYHWRAHMDSTAENPESKRYAFEAGKRAIQAHYDRIGRDNAVVEETEYPGLYRTRYQVKEEPKVSIIIEYKESKEKLERCIKSIESSNWKNYEILVAAKLEEGTKTNGLKVYLETLKEEGRIEVIYNSAGKTEAEIRNKTAEKAAGSYLFYLLGDAEIEENDSIREMTGICMRKEVACVGAKICFSKNLVEHAGVVLGLDDAAGYAFCGMLDGDHNYFSRMNTQMEYSAVAGAGVMVKKSVLEELGGFDEKFTGSFGMIDLCLRAGELGKLSVYTPYARMYHEKEERKPEKAEKEYFKLRWDKKIKNGDPNYNKNLSLKTSDFRIRTEKS